VCSISPERSSNVYLKKKFFTETKMKVTNYDSYFRQGLINASEYDSVIKKPDVKDSNYNFCERSDMAKLESSMKGSCQISSLIIPKKTSFTFEDEEIKNNLKLLRKNTDNFYSEENTKGLLIPEQKIFFKQRQKIDMNKNYNDTIYYGNNSNCLNESKNFYDKNIVPNNIKNFSDPLYVQPQRLQFSKAKTINLMNKSCFLESDMYPNLDYVKKITSNTSTAANSIKSENKNKTTNEPHSISNKEELVREKKRESNFSNKIEKIKNALSNKHNFSFRQLNGLDFDLNKIVDKNRKSETIISKK
jgi:hypothetical protein